MGTRWSAVIRWWVTRPLWLRSVRKWNTDAPLRPKLFAVAVWTFTAWAALAIAVVFFMPRATSTTPASEQPFDEWISEHPNAWTAIALFLLLLFAAGCYAALILPPMWIRHEVRRRAPDSAHFRLISWTAISTYFAVVLVLAQGVGRAGLVFVVASALTALALTWLWSRPTFVFIAVGAPVILLWLIASGARWVDQSDAWLLVALSTLGLGMVRMGRQQLGTPEWHLGEWLMGLATGAMFFIALLLPTGDDESSHRYGPVIAIGAALGTVIVTGGIIARKRGEWPSWANSERGFFPRYGDFDSGMRSLTSSWLSLLIALVVSALTREATAVVASTVVSMLALHAAENSAKWPLGKRRARPVHPFTASARRVIPRSPDEIWEAMAAGLDPSDNTILVWEPGEQLTIGAYDAEPDGTRILTEYEIVAQVEGTAVRVRLSGWLGADHVGVDEILTTLLATQLLDLDERIQHFDSRVSTVISAERATVPIAAGQFWSLAEYALDLDGPRQRGAHVNTHVADIGSVDGEIDEVSDLCLGIRTSDALIRFFRITEDGDLAVVVHHDFSGQLVEADTSTAWLAWLDATFGAASIERHLTPA